MAAHTPTLDTLIADLQQRFGPAAARRGSTLRPPTPPGVLSTGLPALDRLLPQGGLPRRRVSVIGGTPGAGATTLTLHAVAAAQQQGDRVGYLDVGHTVAGDYAAACGVDLAALLLARPRSALEAVDVLEALLAQPVVGMLIVDQLVQLRALPDALPLIQRLFQRLPRLLADSPCALIILAPRQDALLPGWGSGCRALPAPVTALHLQLVHRRWQQPAPGQIVCESSVEVRTPPLSEPGPAITITLPVPIQDGRQ